MNCSKNRVPAVWSNQQKDHSDYARFVLRNGQVQDNTFESYLNNSNTDFLENAPKGAMYVRQHKFKEEADIFKFDKYGNLEIDDLDRDELWNRKKGIMELEDDRTAQLRELIAQYPNLVERDKIKERVEEIKRNVALSVPNRQQVIDLLTRDYILSLYRRRLGIYSAGEQTLIENMETRDNSLKDILNRLTQIEQAQEEDLDMEADTSVLQEDIEREERVRAKKEEEVFGVDGGAGFGAEKDRRLSRLARLYNKLERTDSVRKEDLENVERRRVIEGRVRVLVSRFSGIDIQRIPPNLNSNQLKILNDVLKAVDLDDAMSVSSALSSEAIRSMLENPS